MGSGKSVLEEVEELKISQEKPESEEGIQLHQEEANNASDSNKTGESLAEIDESNTMTQKAIRNMIVKVVNEGKNSDIKELAESLTYLAQASELQSNEKFTQEYREQLAGQLVANLQDEGKRKAIINAAKEQQEKNMRADAFYAGCKPIFELLGIEKAYGFIPMMVTVTLLMVPFLLVSLVRFTINSINSIFTAIAGFKKPAFWLCSIIICLIITAAVVLAAMWGIDEFFGTHMLR